MRRISAWTRHAFNGVDWLIWRLPQKTIRCNSNYPKFKNHRAGGIRTHDLCVPNAAHYQAVLQPVEASGKASNTAREIDSNRGERQVKIHPRNACILDADKDLP